MSASHTYLIHQTEETEDQHGFTTSSFRINPASELPKPRIKTAKSPTQSHLGHSMNGSWDYSTFGADSQVDHEDSNNTAFHTSSSSATLRPTSTQPESPSIPRVAPVTKFVPITTKSSVSAAEVWRDIVVSSNGRDKGLKLIQYTFRLYLFFHLKTVNLLKNPMLGQFLTKRLSKTASGISLARKCLLLFNWLAPLLRITNPSSLPFSSPPGTPSLSHSTNSSKKAQRPLLHRFLHASPPTLLELFQSIADDVYTFSKLGLVPTRIGNRADRISNWLWLLATLAGLVEVGYDQSTVKTLMSDLEDRIYDDEMDPASIGRGGKAGRGKLNGDSIGLNPSGQPNRVDLTVGAEEADAGLQKLQKQYQSLRLSRWKLIMDLIFVSYEVFKFKRLREPVMTASGLASAVLSSKKLFDAQYSKLVKGGDDDGGL